MFNIFWTITWLLGILTFIKECNQLSIKSVCSTIKPRECRKSIDFLNDPLSQSLYRDLFNKKFKDKIGLANLKWPKQEQGGGDGRKGWEGGKRVGGEKGY